MCGRPMAFRENYSREMHFPEGKLFPSAGIGEIRDSPLVVCEGSGVSVIAKRLQPHPVLGCEFSGGFSVRTQERAATGIPCEAFSHATAA